MFTNYIYYYTACLRCLRYAPISSKFRIRTLICSKLFSIDVKSKQQPSPCEVAQLHQVFREPQNVIDSLTDFMTRIDPTHAPTFDLEPRMQGRLWRARIHFTWPIAFRVMGESTDCERARHYAYLEACQMFQHIGLLSSSGQIIDWKCKLEQMQDDVFRRLRLKSSFHFNTSCVKVVAERKQEVVWTSKLELTWPYHIVITGSGCTRKTAEMAAAALAFVKLKSLRYLNKSNAMVASTQYVHLLLKPTTFQAKQTLTPEYEVWVDASKVGYGAYLVSHIDGGRGDTAQQTRWLGDFWPNTIRDCYIVPKHFSSLTEFYALVCAVYTWKKKFDGRSVVVWSDSLNAVTVVNEGLTVDLNAPQGNMFLKLFRILQDTCSQYSITLSARHLNRYNNQAADSLSKLKMKEFFEMVPNATPKAKKSKKLLFFLPLVDMTQRQQLKSCEVK